MGIKRISITQFKCIAEIDIDVKSLNVLIGENAVGKSSIIEAIMYFYNNLCHNNLSYSIFDSNNMLNNKVKISITYDFTDTINKIGHNWKNNKIENENYYRKIMSMLDGKNELTVKLVQIKNKNINWNVEYETRRVLLEMFPFYFVDIREIDLVHWDNLWNSIGDLTKIDNKSQEVLQKALNQEIEDKTYGLDKKLNKIIDSFKSLNIKTKPFTAKEFAAALSQLYFNGNEFLTMERGLTYQSNGANTYNYLCLLFYVLDNISDGKLKEPMVLLDEPEISLHNQLVDTLLEAIIKSSKSVTNIISTHSTRLVKGILKDKNLDSKAIYHVNKINNYSCCKEFQMFDWSDKKQYFFITDEHVNAYFAKELLFVEGETELELFDNEILKALFVNLAKIDVFKALSNEVIHKIVSPERRNFNVPFFSLIDRDKIFNFEPKTRMIKLNNDYINRNKEKEKYLYGNTRYKTVIKKRSILSMGQKCKFSIKNRVLMTSNDTNYNLFNKYITEYFSNYNIIVQETTVEGMLINKDNLELFIKFYETMYKEKFRYLKIVVTGFDHDKQDILNVMRLIFQGENDYLINLKNLMKRWGEDRYSIARISDNLHINYNTWIDAWNNCRISKTSWVSKWILFYFQEVTGVNDEKKIIKSIKEQQKENTKELIELRTKFMEDFPDLYNILNKVCKQYKDVL